MGLLPSEIIKFLQVAKWKGVKGKSLAMMGKQDILVEWDPFIKTIKELGYEYDEAIADKINCQRSIDAFDIFKMFGFGEVHAVDYSEYEGADIVFDLNGELPENLRGAFDYVINGGTLEHVFHIAKAMENMSGMVKNGGMIMHISPVAGWVNHGFYSVSPTFFEDYYGANGFLIKQIELEFIMSEALNGSESVRTFYSEDLRLFRNSSQLNHYIASLQKVKEAGEILLVCFAEKQEEKETAEYPIQGFYQNIYGKSEGSSVLLSRIPFDQVAKVLKNQLGKKALYGCGHACDLLLDELYKINEENRVDAIFDGNIKKAGMKHRGFKILYPTIEKLLSYQQIYVCSVDFENEIEKELLKKGISQECIKKLSEFV